MRSNLFSAGILVVLCFFGLSHETLASRDSDTEAERLLKQAEELTDIRLDGSHPFRLMAHVQLAEEKNAVREGTYLLLWNSPTAWRDETTFDDFSQTRVADGDKLFVSREPPSLTLDIFHLLQLLDFPGHLRLSADAKATKLKEKDRSGSRERSVEIALAGASWKTLFLDLTSPIPIRVEYKHSHYEHQFKDYVDFYGHKFPRALVALGSNKPLIQVQVKELEGAVLEAPSFAPPPDAHWFHWCKEPEHARVKADWMQAGIPIPRSIDSGALKQPVDIYGIIGTDGQWHNLTVVKSAGKEVDSYWLKAMAMQRFLPARHCY